MFKLLKKIFWIFLVIAISIWGGALGLKYVNKFTQKDLKPKLQLLGQFDYIGSAAIASSLDDLLQNNLWSIDVALVKTRLITHPWVNFVVVKKFWPDLLQIELIQHNPLAIWNDQECLTVTGKILPVTAETFEKFSKLNIPRFYGKPEQSLLMIETYLLLLEKLSTMGLTVVKLIIDQTQAIEVVLSNRLNLKLGSFDLPARIARFIIAYKKKFQRNISDISYIDLRYNNGMAVAWLSKEVDLEECKRD